MRCKMCGGHATWEHTVFKGTAPTRIRLCAPCEQKIQADEKLAQIKAVTDHDARLAAVDSLLTELGYS